VFVDVDPDTFCLDPRLVEEAISSRTKAILPVHFGGHPCDMTAIMGLAEKYTLFVIEDCAHAHGAIWDGKYVGAMGTIGSFSLQSSKTLTCGEGGLVVTNHDWLVSTCWGIHNAGRAVGEYDYNHYTPGTNYRITELQAALLLTQMKKFEGQCRKRDKNGALLTELLGKIDGVKPQARDPRVGRHGHYLFTFLLEAGVDREAFKKALSAEGVPLQREYPAVHTLAFIRTRGLGNGSFPVSDALARNSVWMYHHPLLGAEEDVALIAKAIKKVLANKKELA
jgi:dTDP-4-amino-4,6-dideoxygalactose transaminase